MTYWLIRGEWEIPYGLPKGEKGRANFAMEFNDYQDRCNAAGEKTYPFFIFASTVEDANWEHYGTYETAESSAYTHGIADKYGVPQWQTPSQSCAG